MKSNINEKGEVQCPECGQWVKLVHNDKTLMHEIEHCRKKWSFFIDKQKIEEYMNGEVESKKKKKSKTKRKK